MIEGPLNENLTTVQAVLDAEALLAAFDQESQDLAVRLVAADRDVLAALMMFANQAIRLSAGYAGEEPTAVRQVMRLTLTDAIAAFIARGKAA